jgi:hypothetical protein
VRLLSTCNHAFAKFMTHVIRLKAFFCEHRLEYVRLNNAAEFSSRAFCHYCMAQVIEVQHSMTIGGHKKHIFIVNIPIFHSRCRRYVLITNEFHKFC